VAAVGLDAVSEKFGFLRKVAFDLIAQRSFPRAAKREVEGYSGREDDDQKGRQQFEENPVSHFFFLTLEALTLEFRSGSPRRARF
jgi:hypothetical protein